MTLSSFNDPRFRNTLVAGATVHEYLNSYANVLKTVLTETPADSLQKILEVMKSVVLQKKALFVCGNGGSAAVAEHLSCDWMKGTRGKDGRILKVTCLNSNVSLYSAISNDYGFDKVFSTQLEMLANPGDAVVLISSSGNSPNVINACSAAKELGLTTIGLTGFSGGRLKDISDISIHVPFDNYGIVEDAHQMIMHSLAQSLVRLFEE